MKVKNLLFFSVIVSHLSVKNLSHAKNDPSLYPSHQYEGCYENSECDQVMATQLKKWEEIKKQRSTFVLEAFRKEHGIPIEFYTKKSSSYGLRPLFFHSSCKNHNLPERQIYRGLSFVKSLQSQTAHIKRGDALIEIPIGDLFRPQPITVYRDQKEENYYLPIGDQGLFIKNKNLFSLREDDGTFYLLEVSLSGKWKINSSQLAQNWGLKIENVECPHQTSGDVFEAEYCKKIWDDDVKKMVVVKMRKGCAI